MTSLTSLDRDTAAARGNSQTAALNSSTLAIVLAGGNGSRLGELTRWECKPALPFAGKFRNIDFTLSNCVNSGMRRIAVLTQYKSQSLIQHLEAAWSFLPRRLGEFVDLWPAQQRLAPDWYTGTANAVYQNLDLIRAQTPRLILVLAGDHVYKMDYRRLLKRHVQSGAQATVACVAVPVREANGYGVLTIGEDGRVASFVEKPDPCALTPASDGTVLGSMGIYVFNAEYLYERLAQDARDSQSVHDFGRDLIPAAVEVGQVNAYAFTAAGGQPGYWRDVGTLDSYWKAHMELLDRETDFSLFDPQWPIFTHARQLPPAQVLSGNQAGVMIDSLISEGCTVDSATIMRSVLAPGVGVGEESMLEHTVVLPDVCIGARCRINRAIIDTGCSIPPGSVIGEDTVADAGRFTLSEGGVVLVTAEALSRPVRQVA